MFFFAKGGWDGMGRMVRDVIWNQSINHEETILILHFAILLNLLSSTGVSSRSKGLSGIL